ncbi:bifunctional folylpolyglutamate synthase/dihydrofolate synthase [Paenibacillus sp. IB182496]|uniref:tetrahydrofolate synthase n=1 Tax=Paenibacillus sabuli TaxID=2772509 RepID=A0A927GQQ6_9BACL|nr:folylpolyglutamate synthase/dihydrofolate synthase family protein [Paenibacillus sabuli]MBD2844623.1 bifunctional folylpolyglutamate synthase/dihydrofolate synthase [Paenibacillus sabuli]
MRETEKERESGRPFGSYEEASGWIEGLVPLGIRPGLERIELLLDRLGNPHRRLQFIHVAGTNGKGSVCAYLTSVLREAGYDVGTYTSPYLTRLTNRYQYNGSDIGEQDLLELACELKPHVDAVAATELGSPTMFEVSTLLAILFYARRAYPDYVVWETGLGGRLDVTNVVNPVISVITNVGHDHMDILGDSLLAIAKEKAGIIKPGVPIVSAVSQPEVRELMRETAAARRSTLYLQDEQFRTVLREARPGEQVFSFEGPFRALDPLRISLSGAHQIDNAAVAVMALEVLRQYNALIVEDEAMARGLADAAWPGRLEMIRQEPRILLDGAHNPEGAEALAAALRSTYEYGELHLMLGMLANKNHRETLKHILPLAKTVIATEPDFRKRLSAETLGELAEEIRGNHAFELIVEPDWRAALQRLEAIAAPSDLAVVTGTLYLIADVRSRLLNNTESEKGW